MKNGKGKATENAALLNGIMPHGMQFCKDTISLGETECAGMSVTRLPAKVQYEWLTDVCNIPGTVTSITYQPENSVEEILKAIGNTVSNSQLIADGVSTADPVERIRAQKIVEDGSQIIGKIANEGQSIGYMSLSTLVIGKDKADIRAKTQGVRNRFLGRQFSIHLFPFMQKSVFRAVSPCDVPDPEFSNMTGHLLPLSTMLGGFPFAFAGYNDGGGDYFGMDSSGGPVIVDLWRRGEERTNSNLVLMGESGMGKSTALKMLVDNELDLGTKVLAIDFQGEWKEMCGNLGGDWIDVTGGTGGRINILQIYQQAEEDNALTAKMSALAKHINSLEVFFRLYLDLTPILVAVLKECLELTYQEKDITWNTDVTRLRAEHFPIISDLYRVTGARAEEYQGTIAANEVNHYKQLHLLLRNIAIGSDSTIWNGISTVDPQSDFVIFDASSANQTSSNLQAALYHTILNYCEGYLFRNPHERCILVVDEAHIMIDRRLPDTVARLARIEKTCRKFESALWVASQQLVDFLDPAIRKEGSALLDQPNIKIMFPVKRGQDLRDIKELYELTDAEEERLVQGQRGKGLVFIGPRRLSVDTVVPPFRLENMGKGGGR